MAEKTKIERYLIGEQTSILSQAGRGLLRAIEADKRAKRRAGRRALSAEAKLAQAVEAGEICRRARAFDDDEVDIRIEVDRGFYVVWREKGCISLRHTTDASELPSLVTGIIEGVRRARSASDRGEK